MSSRAIKNKVQPLLDEWSQLEIKRLTVGLRMNAELQPHKEAYDKKTAPIVLTAQNNLKPINERISVLQSEITKLLKSGVDETAETVAVSQVILDVEVSKQVARLVAQSNKTEAQTIRSSEAGRPLVCALAEVQVKPGNREIDPQKFFEFVKESKRDAGFWGCLNVLVGKAEKFLGDKINELASKKKAYNVAISLKTAVEKTE